MSTMLQVCPLHLEAVAHQCSGWTLLFSGEANSHSLEWRGEEWQIVTVWNGEEGRGEANSPDVAGGSVKSLPQLCILKMWSLRDCAVGLCAVYLIVQGMHKGELSWMKLSVCKDVQFVLIYYEPTATICLIMYCAPRYQGTVAWNIFIPECSSNQFIY